MSEAEMWGRVRRGVGLMWECERVENRLNVGTPDVTWAAMGVTGWIENKWVPGWPATPEGPLKIKSLTDEQRNWIKRFGRAGGRTFLLLGVGPFEYYLFDHTHIDQLGWVGKSDIRAMSLLRGNSWWTHAGKYINWADLVATLTVPRETKARR